MKLILNIFSGGQDPQVDFSTEDLRSLKSLIAKCVVRTTLPVGNLGYRGFMIYDPTTLTTFDASNTNEYYNVGPGYVQVGFDGPVYVDYVGVESYLKNIFNSDTNNQFAGAMLTGLGNYPTNVGLEVEVGKMRTIFGYSFGEAIFNTARITFIIAASSFLAIWSFPEAERNIRLMGALGLAICAAVITMAWRWQDGKWK